MFSRLSIFWRLALGYLTILALVVGVNLYILNQFRALTELGAELATHHFPAVETAKQLITSLYAQLKSDKQYLVLRDTTLLKDFLQEAENFRKTLKALENQERVEIFTFFSLMIKNELYLKKKFPHQNLKLPKGS